MHPAQPITRVLLVAGIAAATALAAAVTAGQTAARPAQPAGPRALAFQSLTEYGGAYSGVATSGTMAYASRGFLLDVFDVSAPAAPRRIATSARLPAYAPVETAAEDRAYLVERMRTGDDREAWYDQVYVVDVAQATAPVLGGSLRLRRHALEAVVALGPRLYCASAAAGITVIDATDVRRPRVAATVDVGGSVTGIATHGNRLLAAATDAAGDGWLLVLDAGGGAEPVVIGRVAVGRWTGLVVSTGTHAFIESAQRRGDGLNEGMTAIVDLADPTRPRAVGLVRLSDVTAFAVVPGRLFAIEAPMIRDRYHLSSIDTTQLPDTTVVERTYVWARGLAAAGDRVLLADGPQGLVTLAPTTAGGADAIAEENVLPTLGLPMGVALADGRAYVTDEDNELWVLDVRDPAAPVELGRASLSHPSPYGLLGAEGGPLTVREGLAYIARGAGAFGPGGLHVFDVRDARNPVQVGVWDPDIQAGIDPGYDSSGSITNGHAPELAGDRLWLAGYPALTEIDVSDPAQPRFLRHGWLPRAGDSDWGMETGGTATDGRRMYEAAFDRGVYATDVTGTAEITFSGQAEMPGYAQDVALVGSHLLTVGLWRTGLRVLDASSLTAVRAIEDIQGGGIEVVDVTAYVLSADGVVAVDVADPALPVLRGAYRQTLYSDTPQVAVAGDLMALAGGPQGLELVRLVAGAALPAPTIGPTLTPWPTRTPGKAPPDITPLPSSTPEGTPAPATATRGRPVTATVAPRPDDRRSHIFLPAAGATGGDY